MISITISSIFYIFNFLLGQIRSLNCWSVDFDLINILPFLILDFHFRRVRPFGNVRTLRSVRLFGNVRTLRSVRLFGNVRTLRSVRTFGRTLRSVRLFGNVRTLRSVRTFGNVRTHRCVRFQKSINRNSVSHISYYWDVAKQEERHKTPCLWW